MENITVGTKLRYMGGISGEHEEISHEAFVIGNVYEVEVVQPLNPLEAIIAGIPGFDKMILLGTETDHGWPLEDSEMEYFEVVA